MDVVPAGSGWDTDPYTPTIKDGRLYARGLLMTRDLQQLVTMVWKSSKNWAFQLLKSSLHRWNRRRIRLGRYGLLLRARRTCETRLRFLPDAEFPIINGEKGNITEYLHFAGENNGAARLHSFTGGLRENMVPESATAVVSGDLTDLAS